MKFDYQSARVLSIEAQGEEMFGPHYIAFSIQIPEEGNYLIRLDALRGPSAGTIQLMADNKLTGKVAHGASTVRERANGVELGTVHFTRGENQLFLQLKGEVENKPFRADLIRITCKRQ
jgi:hypothetical protein